ncbi:MAG: transcriptional repressor [Firmicutes bacterium]|nr:transcriptional repressor [Bacillota bacterium]
MNRRFSVQKKMIKESLKRLDHPTAAQVYEEIRKVYPQISLGTVYRNLNIMVEDGEIMRLPFSGAPDHFDQNPEEHYHIVCSRCGRIFDTDGIPHELLAELDEAVQACAGVEVQSRILIFYGICAACKKVQ